MKKLLLFAALVLGVVSCMKDQTFDANVGGETDVVLSVALPSDGTRTNLADSATGAIGNIDLAQYDIRYILEVYDAHENLAKRIVKTEDTETSTTFELRLIPGRAYTFVVWADFVAQGTEGDNHYITSGEFGLRNVSLNNASEHKAMDESRDAYTGIQTVSDFNSSSVIAFELKRPFAKLRVVTNDMNQIYKPLLSGKVEYNVQDVYTAFNALAEAPVAASAGSIAVKSFPYDDTTAYATNGENEKTLFADYLFGTASTTVQFALTVTDEVEVLPTVYFNTSIPVQRNYLTTIYGPILTDSNNVTVTINPAFENKDDFEKEPWYQVAVTNGVELIKALKQGRKIIVLNDITVTAADLAEATRAGEAINPVLNLNGFIVTFVNNGNDALLTVAEGSSLTIVDEKGTGAIVLEGNGTAIENNGELNINDTTLTSNGEGSVIVNNGEANIEGATLNEGAVENNAEVNIEGSTLNEGALENNSEANIADSTLNAGSVENNGTANLNGSDVADDAVENGDDAIVGTYVYNAEELQAAINAAEAGLNNEVSFGADIVGDVTAIQKQSVKITINGRGFNYNGSIKVHSNSYHYTDAALTIKDVNFKTTTASVNFVEALENGSQRYSTNITVEDCTFTATGDAVDTAVGVQIKSSKDAKVLNCTATDMHSLIQAQSCDENVEVIGCTINGKNGVAFKQVKAAKVEGTTIVAKEYGIRFDGNTDNYGIVVKNNNVTAYQPLIVRKMTGKNNTITLEGENALTTEEVYNIVITNGSDDAAYVTPTGTYTLTGADNFVVYPRDVVASTPAEILSAMKVKGQTVYIVPTADGSDYKLDGKMSLAEGVKLIGLGDTPVALFNDWGSNAFANQAHFTNTYVENINFTNNLIIDAGIVTGDVQFVNCIFGGDRAHQGVHFDSGNGTLTFDDCTFVGRNMLGASIENVAFNNCTFRNKKSSLTGADKWTGVNMWGKYEFNFCTFDTEAHCNVKCDGVVAAFNSCSYTDKRDITSIINNSNNFTADIKFDGNKFIAEGLIEDENGNLVVNSLETLKTALETAGAAGAGDTTIVFAENAHLDMTGAEWTPIKVDGYNGADIVTIKGNGAVITGLKAPLFAGGFAGGSGIVIENLTIKDSNIVSANTLGSGAFIESVDSMAKIELTNCRLLNSTVTGGAGSRTGGLIGWTAGYSNQNDGPVKTYVTIDGCSVIGCTITCDGSVGGINGHAGNNDWTYTTIKNCTIKNNTLASTDDGEWRVGVVVGTANVGEVTISNITESGNTLTQTGKTAPEGLKRNYYGRFVPGSTGKLIIDGEVL